MDKNQGYEIIQAVMLENVPYVLKCINDIMSCKQL